MEQSVANEANSIRYKHFGKLLLRYLTLILLTWRIW